MSSCETGLALKSSNIFVAVVEFKYMLIAKTISKSQTALNS